MYWSENGAWMGELSARMLVDCGLDLVLVGHSKQRQRFGETDRIVALKTATAVQHRLVRIVCVGETRAEHEAGSMALVIEAQVRGALESLAPQEFSAPLLFAYEPLWMIGDSATAATPAWAEVWTDEIGAIPHDVLGRCVPVLYGGSISPDNCAALLGGGHVDGLFVGRSAWRADDCLETLDACRKLQKTETRRLR